MQLEEKDKKIDDDSLNKNNIVDEHRDEELQSYETFGLSSDYSKKIVSSDEIENNLSVIQEHKDAN